MTDAKLLRKGQLPFFLLDMVSENPNPNIVVRPSSTRKATQNCIKGGLVSPSCHPIHSYYLNMPNRKSRQLKYGLEAQDVEKCESSDMHVHWF